MQDAGYLTQRDSGLERLHDDDKLMAETNEALATAGLKVEGNQKIRHMVEVLIEDIIESACDGGADMIVTPCPVCQMNVEVYQDHINQKYQTNFKMPVVYYSTLMSVAYGGSGKEAGLDDQIIKGKQLEDIASR